MVPADRPATMPDEEPTAAIPVRALVHTPPDVPSLRVCVCPRHTWGAPLMGVGTG